MRRDQRSIEDLLRQSRPPEVPQMPTALGRVLNRLHADHGAETDTPTIEWNGARRTRLFRPVFAAAIVIVAVGGAIVWPRGGVRVYAAGNDGLQVTLADDSRVEMRAHAEMTVGRAPDGIRIDLKTGDIIVSAARQRDGHLTVRTKDVTVALDGAVFLVNAGQQGSRVGVIEGEVRVQDGKVETKLRPGEQLATSATIAQRPLADDIMWSRNKDAHRAILESFTRGIAQTSGPLSPVVPPGERQRSNGAVVPATVEFEEASIRECDPDNLPPTPPGARGGGANSFQMTPGRLYALCMTPAVMVRIAHGFLAMPEGSLSADTRRGSGWRLNQVSGQGANSGIAVRGGPDWARNQRYSIEAVAGTDADADTMSGPMFRSLLERRFKLKTHIETEEVPVWKMTVAPGGLKIKPMAPDGCDESPPASPGSRSPSPRTPEEVRGGAKPTCGMWAPREPGGGNVVMMAGGSTIAEFVDRLRSRLASARITDETGVGDRFNFIVEFLPDNQESIVSAVERLGLRLEQSRASREFLVIDSIERPGPN